MDHVYNTAPFAQWPVLPPPADGLPVEVRVSSAVTKERFSLPQSRVPFALAILPAPVDSAQKTVTKACPGEFVFAILPAPTDDFPLPTGASAVTRKESFRLSTGVALEFALRELPSPADAFAIVDPVETLVKDESKDDASVELEETYAVKYALSDSLLAQSPPLSPPLFNWTKDISDDEMFDRYVGYCGGYLAPIPLREHRLDPIPSMLLSL